MIVERYIWTTKAGCRAEFIKLVKALVEEQGLTSRVCTYVDDPQDIVIVELEFESMEARQEWRDSRDASGPAAVAFHEKLPDLLESRRKELLQTH